MSDAPHDAGHGHPETAADKYAKKPEAKYATETFVMDDKYAASTKKAGEVQLNAVRGSLQVQMLAAEYAKGLAGSKIEYDPAAGKDTVKEIHGKLYEMVAAQIYGEHGHGEHHDNELAAADKQARVGSLERFRTLLKDAGVKAGTTLRAYDIAKIVGAAQNVAIGAINNSITNYMRTLSKDEAAQAMQQWQHNGKEWTPETRDEIEDLMGITNTEKVIDEFTDIARRRGQRWHQKVGTDGGLERVVRDEFEHGNGAFHAHEHRHAA